MKCASKSGIFFAPEQDAIGGKAVATGAARFLVILLDGFRQREMDHGADGGFIDAQAESDGADKDGNSRRTSIFPDCGGGWRCPFCRDKPMALIPDSASRMTVSSTRAMVGA